MSSDLQNNSRRRVVRWLIILGISALVLLLLILQAQQRKRLKIVQTHGTEASVLSAMKAYTTEYGYSIEGEPLEILRALRGDNRRRIIFFEAPVNRINDRGELVDPWNTPYRFDLSKLDSPRVWSCGPNRKDENGADGSDDVASWR